MPQDVRKLSVMVEHFNFCLFWLRWLYPKSKGIPLLYLLYYFVPQKIIRINGRVPWPVHFTSRVLYHKKITVDNRSAPGINAGCYIQARNGIKIGHNFRIGPGVGLISSNHELDNYDRYTDDKPITIGNNVWIAMNSVITPGITIGDNVVIGANSVVTKDIPSNSIAVGNPCSVIADKKPYQGKDYSIY